MSIMIHDVSFPLQGHDAAAPVRDRLPLRLIELSGCAIDSRWGGDDMTAPTWRLYFDLDDGAEAWVHGRCTALRAGHLYLVPAWLRWSGRCRRPVRHFNAMFDLPALPRERVMALCREVVPLAAPGDALAGAWMDCAVAQASVAQAGATHIANGHAVVWAALARLFVILGVETDALVPADRHHDFERLRHWVEQRLDQRLPRSALARAAGVSEAELARRCAVALGTSPARWLRDLRVARAAELLRASDVPIETVAEHCGLGDRSRFSKVFARVVGCGPAGFRRRFRG